VITPLPIGPSCDLIDGGLVKTIFEVDDRLQVNYLVYIKLEAKEARRRLRILFN